MQTNKKISVSKKTRSVSKSKTPEVALSMPLYDINGTEVERITLPEHVFNAPASPRLIAQYIRVYLARQRMAGARTQTRGEVSGSKRKIYRQKGTGGARHGARKAPIFVGGGTAHGPKGLPRQLKISNEQKRRALFGALSQRVREKNILFIKGLVTVPAKTKAMVDVLGKLNVSDSKLMLVTTEKNNALSTIRAARNINGLTLRDSLSLNAYDIMRHSKLIFMSEALDSFTKHYAHA